MYSNAVLATNRIYGSVRFVNNSYANEEYV